MYDLHINDFCKDTAKILIALYKRFPQKTTLYVEDIAGPDNPDEFGLHSERHMACLSSMLWLAENGLITYSQTIRQEAIEEACLSQKSFTFFSSIDFNIQSSEAEKKVTTRISTVTKTLKESSSDTLAELIIEYLKKI